MFKIRSFFKLTSRRYLNKNSALRYSTKPKVVISEEPIKYSESPASKYKARTTITGVTVPRLWYEPYVILTSFTAFLIYFTILREENDIDEELGRSLYSRIPGLEEQQLKLSLNYNQQHGLDTEAITKRLKEIEKEKSKMDQE